MVSVNRRRLWIGATILIVFVVAATAYALRGRLANAPLVGRFVSSHSATEASQNPDEIAHWTCPMHPHVKEHGPGKCPECGMDLVPVTNAEAKKTPADGSTAVSGDPAAAATAPESAGTARAEITIDPRRQQLIGVRTVPVERRALTATVRTVGVVRYDETKLADVNLKLEGWVRDLYVDATGEFVKAGQPLFTLYSPELLTTQNEYLLALKTREQMRSSQVSDAREYADRLVDAARQR